MTSQLTSSFLIDPFQVFAKCQFCAPEDMTRLKAESYLSAAFWDIFDALFQDVPWLLTAEEILQARAEYLGTEEYIHRIENGHMPITRQEIDEYMVRCQQDVAGGFRVMPLTAHQRERLEFQALLRPEDDGHQLTSPGDYEAYLDLRLSQLGLRI